MEIPWFLKLKNVKRTTSLLLLAALLTLINGCSYFRVHKSQSPADSAVSSLQEQRKFFILHRGEEAWQLKNIVAGQDSLKGVIMPLFGHDRYKTADTVRLNRFYSSDMPYKKDILNEVHIYVNDFSLRQDNIVSIPVTAVKKIEVFDPAYGATAASYIFGAVVVTATVVAIVAIIVALTKESCPFIYVHNGERTSFVGEIYSGAVNPSLERSDYLPLPDASPNQKEYHITMTNEVREVQNTNLIELKVYDHPSGTDLLVDKYGICQTTTDLQTPVTAVNFGGRDVLGLIRNKDTLSYFNTDQPGDDDLKDGIIMDFRKPQDAKTARLVINAKSTFWLDYSYTRFMQLFGTRYERWSAEKAKTPPEQMRKWQLDQGIPLSVSIWKNEAWQFVDYYNIIGPMAFKKDILAFDVSDLKSENLRVRLEYGKLFWDIDYVSVDYSLNTPVREKTAEFISAVDERENDVKPLLSDTDMMYYVQPEIGNRVEMKFILPAQSDSKRTLILHSQGHYHVLVNTSGQMHKSEIKEFRKEGHFIKFSNELFKKQSHLIMN